jgi:hypothetical protein
MCIWIIRIMFLVGEMSKKICTSQSVSRQMAVKCLEKRTPCLSYTMLSYGLGTVAQVFHSLLRRPWIPYSVWKVLSTRAFSLIITSLYFLITKGKKSGLSSYSLEKFIGNWSLDLRCCWKWPCEVFPRLSPDAINGKSKFTYLHTFSKI